MHARPVVGDQETPHKNILRLHMASPFSQIHVFVVYMEIIQASCSKACVSRPPKQLLKTSDVNKESLKEKISCFRLPLQWSLFALVGLLTLDSLTLACVWLL